jgi:hypothetical protein
MKMLYNSENFAVVRFEMDAQTRLALSEEPAPAKTRATRPGYEIVDKSTKREIYLHGVMAEHFKRGVENLIDSDPSDDDIDLFISGYAALAQQPVVLH